MGCCQSSEDQRTIKTNNAHDYSSLLTKDQVKYKQLEPAEVFQQGIRTKNIPLIRSVLDKCRNVPGVKFELKDDFIVDTLVRSIGQRDIEMINVLSAAFLVNKTVDSLVVNDMISSCLHDLSLLEALSPIMRLATREFIERVATNAREAGEIKIFNVLFKYCSQEFCVNHQEDELIQAVKGEDVELLRKLLKSSFQRNILLKAFKIAKHQNSEIVKNLIVRHPNFDPLSVETKFHYKTWK